MKKLIKWGFILLRFLGNIWYEKPPLPRLSIPFKLLLKMTQLSKKEKSSQNRPLHQSSLLPTANIYKFSYPKPFCSQWIIHSLNSFSKNKFPFCSCKQQYFTIHKLWKEKGNPRRGNITKFWILKRVSELIYHLWLSTIQKNLLIWLSSEMRWVKLFIMSSDLWDFLLFRAENNSIGILLILSICKYRHNASFVVVVWR